MIDNANATVANADDTITAVREPLQTELADIHKTLDQVRSLIGDLQAAVQTKDQGVTDIIENLRTATIISTM